MEWVFPQTYLSRPSLHKTSGIYRFPNLSTDAKMICISRSISFPVAFMVFGRAPWERSPVMLHPSVLRLKKLQDIRLCLRYYVNQTPAFYNSQIRPYQNAHL